MIILIAMQTEH